MNRNGQSWIFATIQSILKKLSNQNTEYYLIESYYMDESIAENYMNLKMNPTIKLGLDYSIMYYEIFRRIKIKVKDT